MPNLGKVCLAEGELNLNFCSKDKHEKNNKFFALI